MKSFVSTIEELYILRGDEVFSCFYWKTHNRKISLMFTEETFWRALMILQEEGRTENAEQILYEVMTALLTEPCPFENCCVPSPKSTVPKTYTSTYTSTLYFIASTLYLAV